MFVHGLVWFMDRHSGANPENASLRGSLSSFGFYLMSGLGCHFFNRKDDVAEATTCSVVRERGLWLDS